MYAIIEVGGHQHRVEPGHWFEINRVVTKVGATHPVERVLLAADGGEIHIGTPFVAGAKVVCEVLKHHLGPKVISYKFRRRENWRKTVGHRQPLSLLLVKEIIVGSGRWPAAALPSAPRAERGAPASVGGKNAPTTAAPHKTSAKPKTAAKPAAKKPHHKE